MSRARLVSGAARGQQTEGWSRARRWAAAGHVVRAAGDLPACHLQRSGNCGGECPPRSLSLSVSPLSAELSLPLSPLLLLSLVSVLCPLRLSVLLLLQTLLILQHFKDISRL